MTSPARAIEIECPRCELVYEAWHRRSINLGLGEEWSAERLREATTATCPSCAFLVELEALVVDGDVWRLG